MKTIELLRATGNFKKGEIRTVMSVLADFLVMNNLARYYAKRRGRPKKTTESRQKRQ